MSGRHWLRGSEHLVSFNKAVPCFTLVWLVPSLLCAPHLHPRRRLHRLSYQGLYTVMTDPAVTVTPFHRRAH